MIEIKAILKVLLYKPLFNALIFLVWLIPGHSVGWAIIILTVIVRLLLLPSSLKATVAQKRLLALQPKLEEIKQKYKDDKTAQTRAIMAFYKENKINPLGSCLPLLIQFPILIILYYVFIHGLDTSRFDLLYSWMPHPAYMNAKFLGIDLAKPDRWILPIAAGVFQFVQAKQMTPAKKTSDMQGALQSQMLYLMPVFTILIATKLPAALPLYWIVTTLFAIFQQWIVLRKKEVSAETGGVKSEKKGNVVVTVRKKGQ